MNLVKVIENIEIERDNNKRLAIAVEARLATLKETTNALLAQAMAYVETLKHQTAAIQNAMDVSRQEFADRDKALAALIGGDE
jgi:hypothetical protein